MASNQLLMNASNIELVPVWVASSMPRHRRRSAVQHDPDIFEPRQATSQNSVDIGAVEVVDCIDVTSLWWLVLKSSGAIATVSRITR